MVDILCLQEQEEKGRWFIAADMNCDGVFTISDIGSLIEWVFFLPGDGLLFSLVEIFPGIGTFLELTPANFGGWFSGFVSVIAWVLTLGNVLGMWLVITRSE